MKHKPTGGIYTSRAKPMLRGSRKLQDCSGIPPKGKQAMHTGFSIICAE